jgi:outer membrane biosynthesis protein TonB
MATRRERYPALAASALLHGAIIAAALIAWPWAHTLHMGDVVPVTLMTSADLPAPAPAVQAPTPAPAATEQPTPQAPPQPAAQEEHPTPPQPLPKAQPTPQPKAAHTPTKATPTPRPAENWAALEASLARQSRQTSGARQSSAAQGRPRPNQALQARNTQGVGAVLSSGPANARAEAALGSLSGEIGRLWLPNCGVPVGDLLIKVSFKLGPEGILDGDPTSSEANAPDLASRVASERAVRAIRMRSPFADPAYAALYGQNVTVSFSQKQHCSSR